MAIRVSPTEPDPTHHISLRDRDGHTIGLIMADEKGAPKPVWNKNPVDRTALKTTSGGGTYSDFNPPYAPVVQDDWSGGRANLDFERDSTRFLTSRAVCTRNQNRLTLGPRIRFSTKGPKAIHVTPNHASQYMVWYDCYLEEGTKYIAYFTPTTTFTSYWITLWLRMKPGYTGAMGSLTVNLREGSVNGTVIKQAVWWSPGGDNKECSTPWYSNSSVTLVAGTTYYLTVGVITGQWQYQARQGSGTIGNNLNGRGYAVMEVEEDLTETCIFYEYKNAQYAVITPTGGSPQIWMNGDRGTADSNAGDTSKLQDATKNWTVDQFKGAYMRIISGTGKSDTPYVVASNTATALQFGYGVAVAMDTSTEYVIQSDTWRELTGHGLTKVTAVLAVGETVLFAQGDLVLMRRHREYNNAGVWTESDWAAEAAGSYATHLCYQPLASKVWRAQNTDSSSIANVAIAAAPMTLIQAYGTPLAFATAIPVGGKYEAINGLVCYPNDNGQDAVWAHKEELAYIVITAAEGIKLQEMRNARSRTNGRATVIHNVYQYFSMGNGIQRYYSGNIDSVGPNLDEGLSEMEAGPVVQMIGMPGRVLAAITGSYGSGIYERSGSGWHEIYSSPNYPGPYKKIKAMAIQPFYEPRLWIYQGNRLLYLNLGDATKTQDLGFQYENEGELYFSRMHAGMFDVQKLVKSIKVWSDQLGTEVHGDEITTVEVDYSVDDGPFYSAGTADTSPMTTLDMTPLYGLAGKRIQLRVRLSTNYSGATPKVLAVIIEAVLRAQVKYQYSASARIVDNEPTLVVAEFDDDSTTAAGGAMAKLTKLESFADADNDSLLLMRSTNPLYDGKYVFLNPPATHAIAENPDATQQWTGNAYIATVTMQDA